jgi:hypothetical protein
VAEEVRPLIRRMKIENPTWGAPRIHGELPLLGFDISEPIVSRYLRRRRIPDEGKAHQWLAFLNKHREVIAALDCLTVPTLYCRALYCFFTIEHGRRRILHFNVTLHPTATGSCNNCGKRSRSPALIDTSCSTTIPSSAMKY